MIRDMAWIDRANKNLEEHDITIKCPSCSKSKPISEFKKHGKEQKLVCKECIEKEDSERKKRADERRSQQTGLKKTAPAAPVIDIGAISEMIKTAVKEGMSSVITTDTGAMTGVTDAINGLKNEIKRNDDDGKIVLPMPLSVRAALIFTCKNSMVSVRDLMVKFGENRLHQTKMLMLRMWVDKIVWKNASSRYMINPEMDRERLVSLVGTDIEKGEFLTFMRCMREQAISKKFKPFSMIPVNHQKYIEKSLRLT